MRPDGLASATKVRTKCEINANKIDLGVRREVVLEHTASTLGVAIIAVRDYVPLVGGNDRLEDLRVYTRLMVAVESALVTQQTRLLSERKTIDTTAAKQIDAQIPPAYVLPAQNSLSANRGCHKGVQRWTEDLREKPHW